MIEIVGGGNLDQNTGQPKQTQSHWFRQIQAVN